MKSIRTWVVLSPVSLPYRGVIAWLGDTGGAETIDFSVTLLFGDQTSYNFFLNKLLITALLIVSIVVVKFRY